MVNTTNGATVRHKDMHAAESVEDVMELRKQETRRRVTYLVVAAYCVAAGYLLIWGPTDAGMAAFSGLLGLAGPIIGFYFGAKQTGQ